MLNIYMMCYFHRLLAVYRVRKMFGFGKERVKISPDYSNPVEEKGNQETSEKIKIVVF